MLLPALLWSLRDGVDCCLVLVHVVVDVLMNRLRHDLHEMEATDSLSIALNISTGMSNSNGKVGKRSKRRGGSQHFVKVDRKVIVNRCRPDVVHH
jgi:hypothetical protein